MTNILQTRAVSRVTAWLKEAWRRDRALTLTAGIHSGLFFVFLLFILIDPRQLLGINVWIKPSKFALSIAIYTFSLACIMVYVRNKTVKRIISYGTVTAMYIEIILISFQAARGKMSHFNQETLFDILVYVLMGVAITLSTLFAVLLLIVLIKKKGVSHPPLLRAVQLGLCIMIIGSVFGGYMASQMQHTVGAPDGGPGTVYVNWSEDHGDLRTPHFFGLHALQIVPLITLMFTNNRIKTTKRAMWIPWTVASIYGLFVGITFFMAIKGVPLF